VISYFVYGAILWLFPEKRRLIATFARGALKRLQLRAS
jgi:uncharacterized membrane protein (GlpM family)